MYTATEKKIEGEENKNELCLLTISLDSEDSRLFLTGTQNKSRFVDFLILLFSM